MFYHAHMEDRGQAPISPCLKLCLSKDLLFTATHTEGVRNPLVLICSLTERTLEYRYTLLYPACMSSENQIQVLSLWPRNQSVKGREGGKKHGVEKTVLKARLPGVTQRSQIMLGSPVAILRPQPKLQHLHINLKQWFSLPGAMAL